MFKHFPGHVITRTWIIVRHYTRQILICKQTLRSLKGVYLQGGRVVILLVCFLIFLRHIHKAGRLTLAARLSYFPCKYMESSRDIFILAPRSVIRCDQDPLSPHNVTIFSRRRQYDKNEDKNHLGYRLGVILRSSQTYELENVITLHKTIADYTYCFPHSLHYYFLPFLMWVERLFFEEISNVGQWGNMEKLGRGMGRAISLEKAYNSGGRERERVEANKWKRSGPLLNGFGSGCSGQAEFWENLKLHEVIDHNVIEVSGTRCHY